MKIEISITTDFTKFFAGNKDFQSCINSILYSDRIDVICQDNSTNALESSYIDMIWKGGFCCCFTVCVRLKDKLQSICYYDIV
jgi:hypothetical protein